MSSLPKQIIRFAERAGRRDTDFEIVLDAPARDAVAKALNLVGIKKLRFDGRIEPKDKHDWILKGKLGATVVQECVVTLEPVTTRIDETVLRTYLRDMPEYDASEAEMDEDDSIDQLPAELDLAEVMIESISLALPPFPRKEGVELGEAVYTAPGAAPMRDEDTRAFAGLSSLKESLEKKDEDGQ